MNLDFVLTILVLVLALAGLAYPLYRARTQIAGVNVSTLDDLLAQRDGVYATLRDLELDQELGKLDAAKVPLAAVEHRMAGLDRWFQGRELVETLRIRIAAAEGRSQEALKFFEAASNLAEHADAASAAWLTASVADVLFAERQPEIRDIRLATRV